MPRSSSRPTIREVAALAGVSHQTISRVINGNDRVSPETRQRVEAAIRELGYSPNAIAQNMARGRSQTFACFSPNLTDYTFASIIEGAETEARQKGYFVISASAPDETTFRDLIDQLVTSRRTDGLLVINPYVDGRYQFLPKNIPVVYLGARPREDPVAAVALDEEKAGRLAAGHLLSLGHRQIAQITGPVCEDCVQDRQLGFIQALEAEGLSIDSDLAPEGDWSATSGYLAARKILSSGRPFTAIFAQNDRMAVGAIRALREEGKRIPEDVSVIGFDDMPLASYFDPPLTTIRQDPFSIGQEASSLLFALVEKSEVTPRQIRLAPELIVRGSTGPANTGNPDLQI